MDWPAREDEIQAMFFGDTPFGCLSINHVGNEISWEFLFLDFGMYHTINGKNRVVYSSNGLYSVDNNEALLEKDALFYVFGGHYEKNLEEFYADIGFNPRPK